MKIKLVSLVAAIGWTLIMLFAVVHNSNNERFWVTHFTETVSTAHTTPGYYKVEASPSWLWDHNQGAGVTWGYVFLALMWLAMIVVAADLHLKFMGSDKSQLGQFLPAAFIVLSMIFFISGYSSKSGSNWIDVPEQTFNEWVETGEIEQKGEHTYVDATESKPLIHLFDNKRVIN